MEGDEQYKDKLLATLETFPKEADVVLKWGFVELDTIEAILGGGNGDKGDGELKDLDVLKVDIDSFDYELTEKILQLGYKPKVIMVEMNPDVPPPFMFYSQYDKSTFEPSVYDLSHVKEVPKAFAGGNYGASASAWWKLLTKDYNYGIVHMEVWDPTYQGCKRCEHNIWLVAGEYLHAKGIKVIDHDEMAERFFESHMKAPQLGCIHIPSCPLAKSVQIGPQMGSYVNKNKWWQKCENSEVAESFTRDRILAKVNSFCTRNDTCLSYCETYRENSCE